MSNEIIQEHEIRSQAGASDAGYHFYNTYLTCPRKFYLSYIKGLKPIKTHKALIFGKIFHDMVELTYLRWNPDKVVQYGTYAMEKSYDQYVSEEAYREDMLYLEPMYRAWFQYAYNPDEKVIELEKSHVLDLNNDLILTGRIDRVLEIDGRLAIIDTKTSKGQWASLDKPIKPATQGDQFTLYRLMVMQDYNLDYIPDVYIDVIICKSYVKTGVTATSSRVLLPSVAQEELDQIYNMYTGLIDEVSYKMYQLNQDVNPDYLFPRSSILCSTYGCEMEKICRSLLPNVNISGTFKVEPPSGLIQNDVNVNMEKGARE